MKNIHPFNGVIKKRSQKYDDKYNSIMSVLLELKDEINSIKTLFKNNTSLPEKQNVERIFDINNLTNGFLTEIKMTKSINTYLCYKKSLEYFVQFCDTNINPMEISKIEVQNLKRWLISKFSKRSCHVRLMSIRSFYHWLKNNEFINDNPIVNVFEKLEKLIPRPLPINDIQRILTTLRSEQKDKYIAVYTMIACGCRLSEVPKIIINDVDIDNSGTVKIRIVGKGNKERIVLSIFYEYDQLIKEWIKNKNPGEHLINLSINQIKYICKHLSKKLNLPFSPRRFRHTYATILIKIDITKLARLMGHSDIKTTEIYRDLTINDIIEEVNKVKM